MKGGKIQRKPISKKASCEGIIAKRSMRQALVGVPISGEKKLYPPKFHMAKASQIIKYLFYDPRFWTAEVQENGLYYPRISLSWEQRRCGVSEHCAKASCENAL